MLFHEVADGGGRVRLEIGNRLAKQRPAGEARRNIKPRVPPLEEYGEEEHSYDRGKKTED